MCWQIGWSKVQELRRYIKLFRDSGKYTIAYMKVCVCVRECVRQQPAEEPHSTL